MSPRTPSPTGANFWSRRRRGRMRWHWLPKGRTSSTWAGIRPEQVVLDVGIGVGKTVKHNLALLGALKRFTKFERPLLLGVSRKSFLGKLLGLEVTERLPAALACACWAIQAGAQIIRTH